MVAAARLERVVFGRRGSNPFKSTMVAKVEVVKTLDCESREVGSTPTSYPRPK